MTIQHEVVPLRLPLVCTATSGSSQKPELAKLATYALKGSLKFNVQHRDTGSFV